MNKHTQRPWTAVHRAKHMEIVGPNGESITALTAWIDERQDEMHANADLIAAAPELLEALQECLNCSDKAAIKKALAAIDKATGEINENRPV